MTSFRTRDLRTWRRERPGSPDDVFTVLVGVGPAQIALTGGWPPRLLVPSGSGTNAAAAGTVITRTDTVAGGIAQTEVGGRPGAASGGAPILRFVSGLRTPDGRHVIADGLSASSATLDTLLLMFGTLARSPVPDPNRR
ncbi:MAG TPA: hypothetical protein VEA99_00645 [Gemmatimonadaceae bacterium]|nr:hypothetical protein [Gemmatimonadaceae bacterium]